MEQTIVLEKFAIPADVKGGKNSVKPFISAFTTVIKPLLNQLTLEINSFFYPCEKSEQRHKDFVWLTNKYGMQTGRRYVIQKLPNGLRFFLAADQLPVEKHMLTEKYAKLAGLEQAIAPIVPEILAEPIVPTVTETPAN